MDRIRVFQSLIFISLFVYLVWGIFPLNWIVRGSGELLPFDGYGAILNPHGRFLTIIVFSLWLFAKIGIFFFLNWARYLYLGLTIWSIVGVVFFGVQVASPLDSMITSVINFLDSVILGMAYFPTVNNLFMNKSGENTE